MKQSKFRTYYLLCLAGILLASFYPLYMGIKVLIDYVQYGYVLGENYPKYLIPYTPISLSLILGAVLLPLGLKAKRWGQACLTAVCFLLFFGFELLMENLVIHETYHGSHANLGDWQMYLCVSTPITQQEQTAISILIGEYSPTFKLHFYAISLILITAVINCLYGFGEMLRSGDCSRRKALILQSVGTVFFLGLCILACFTAFFRTGTILVSPLSALLMALFFILFGVIAGIFSLSFLQGRSRRWAILPTAVSCAMTLLMYIGEMCLLSGHLYRFGAGWFFDGLGSLVMAPVDILIVILSGAVTAATALALLKRSDS